MVLMEGGGLAYIVVPIFIFMALTFVAASLLGMRMIHNANERRIRLGLEKGVCPACKEVLHCPKCGPLMKKNDEMIDEP